MDQSDLENIKNIEYDKVYQNKFASDIMNTLCWDKKNKNTEKTKR
jgi:hypothetical protein